LINPKAESTPREHPSNASAQRVSIISPCHRHPYGARGYKKSLFRKSCEGRDFQKRLRAVFKKKAVVPDLSSFPDYVAAGFST